MAEYRGEELQLHIFLNSAVDKVGGQLHIPAALTPGKQPPISSI
jgi:hypothetical protein